MDRDTCCGQFLYRLGFVFLWLVVLFMVCMSVSVSLRRVLSESYSSV